MLPKGLFNKAFYDFHVILDYDDAQIKGIMACHTYFACWLGSVTVNCLLKFVDIIHI